MVLLILENLLKRGLSYIFARILQGLVLIVCLLWLKTLHLIIWAYQLCIIGAEHVRTVFVQLDRDVDQLLLVFILRRQPLHPEATAILTLYSIKRQADVGARGRLWDVHIAEAD